MNDPKDRDLKDNAQTPAGRDPLPVGTMPYSDLKRAPSGIAHAETVPDGSDAKTVFGEMRATVLPASTKADAARPPMDTSEQKTIAGELLAKAAPTEKTLTGDGPLESENTSAGLQHGTQSDGTQSDGTLRGPLTAPTRMDGEEDSALGEKIRAHLELGDRREKKDALLGELLGGRFLVLKKIGAGGMGAVYRARQEGMDRDVAVKVLLGDLSENDTVLRRFTLEALAVSRLKHPNTIQIFDYGTTPQGNPYIAMELLEGSTLHDVLRKERPLPIRRALRMMSQVAASLGEAHSKGIVHRDLKPENIFLISVSGNPDFVKVLDFGVAKMRDKDEKGTLTQAGSIFGTPRYMSPEQCSAQPVDHRSDLYALGVILFEMITGMPPFQSEQPLTLLLSHVNEMPPQPSTIELLAKDGTALKQVIPAEVEELVMKLLEKEPDDRVQTSEDLSRLCQQLAETLPPAFDARVGEAEAEGLGVRLPSMHTMNMTARTMKMTPEQAAAMLNPAPALVLPPKKNNNALIGIVVGLVVATGAAVAVVSAEKPVAKDSGPQVIRMEAPPGTVIPPPAAPPKADEVTATITSQPPGATVLRGTEKLGVTNLTLTRKKGAPAEVVQLTLPGHKAVDLTLNFEQNFMQHVQLQQEAAAAVAPVAARPRPTGTPGPVVSKPEAPKVEAPKVETKPEPKVEEKKPEKKKKEELVEEIM